MKKQDELKIRTLDQQRSVMESLFIGFFIGVVMVPASFEIQFWIVAMLPLLIEMIGQPTSLLAWIPNSLYPIIPGLDYDNPGKQHFFLILIVLTLLLFGPKRKGETAIAKIVASD